MASEEQKGVRAGTLNVYHFAVILLSLTLTLIAWLFSRSQVEEKIRFQFDRETTQIVERIRERMQTYEDALRGGASYIQGTGGSVSYKAWKSFTDDFKIHERYPGINGIGVIYQIDIEEKDSFVAQERQFRPQFDIHPVHNKPDSWPITLIEPLEGNEKAVGLDMAFEKNRYTSILKAKATGQMTITGPITLVQDTQKTPGFLFYDPYYKEDLKTTELTVDENFLGVVYAPFIVSKLMAGTLKSEGRNINIRIVDEGEVLYEEYQNVDVRPLHKANISLEMYGRQWQLSVESNLSFRKQHESHQPLTILFAGVIIDLLILAIFLAISRSSRKAYEYAERKSADLRASNYELRQREIEIVSFQNQLVENSKMASLGNMSAGISHELNQPLGAILLKAELIQKLIEKGRFERILDITREIKDNILRVKKIMDALRRFSRKDESLKREETNINDVVEETTLLFVDEFKISGVDLQLNLTEGAVACVSSVQLGQVLTNLIINARDAVENESEKQIVIATELDGTEAALIEISDNGSGIEEKDLKHIFEPFYTTKPVGKGTGLGLSLSYSMIKDNGGEITVDSQVGKGSCFSIKLPLSECGACTG